MPSWRSGLLIFQIPLGCLERWCWLAVGESARRAVTARCSSDRRWSCWWLALAASAMPLASPALARRPDPIPPPAPVISDDVALSRIPSDLMNDEGLQLVLDRRTRQLMVLKDGRLLRRYPAAVGTEGWETPAGRHQVLAVATDRAGNQATQALGEVEAQQVEQTVNLTVTVVGSGVVTPTSGSYISGTVTPLTATANPIRHPLTANPLPYLCPKNSPISKWPTSASPIGAARSSRSPSMRCRA